MVSRRPSGESLHQRTEFGDILEYNELVYMVSHQTAGIDLGAMDVLKLG